jgi:hypothetical protein
MPTTTNYGWTTPADTDLVKDGASAIRTLGTAIDTTVFTNAGNAIQKSIVDAKGDIIAATADNTVDRLAVGSNDQVLTADSSTATGLKWAAPAAGGMTLLSTTTLTGASVTIGSITTDYKNLQLIIRNYKPATDGTELWMRFNSDSNNNRYRLTQLAPSTTNLSFNTTRLVISEAQDNTDATGLIVVDIFDYANTTTWKYAQMAGFVNESTTPTNFSFTTYNGYYNQTSAISDVVLLPSAGNFTSGTALLYGVK